MKIIKFAKIPFLLIVGIAIGFIISNTLIFSVRKERKEVSELEIKNENLNTLPYKVFQPYIPKKLSFCGEEVPLELFDVNESLDFELIANTYRHSSTILYLKRANRYFPEIERMLAANNIPDDFKFLCVAESGIANVTSSAGAKGFWQFMKATAIEKNLVVNKNIDERNNMHKSLNAASEYLHTAHKKFGSWTLAAASYNMGMGGLQRDINYQRVNNYWDLKLNQETARYIYRILALKIIMTYPEKYGFDIPEQSLYPKLETYSIKVDSTINDLVQFSFDNGINYKMLIYFNPWIIGKTLDNPKRKEYTITLPKKSFRRCNIPKQQN